MRTRGGSIIFACALALLFLASAQGAREATPPDRNDPCARNARDTCGTTGVGYYKVGRYGQRWYGDFRGVIPGVAHAYCIDLRFWYPSSSYRYREDTSGTLLNKAGEPVSALHRQLISYAIARYGQTTDPDQAVAVMLYVHSLMGDSRAGELDPNAVSPAVASFYARVQRDSQAYHGPYRIDVRLIGGLTVGRRASANVRVLSATGNPVSGVSLAVAGDGVTTRSARTASTGGAAVSFTPASASPRFTIRATGLPSTLPRVYAPSTPVGARNGQRLVVAATQEISASLRTAASKRQIGASTTATPATLAVGEAGTDKVSITGAAPGWKATIAVKIYGPFASAKDVRCDDTPTWQGSFTTNGPGTYTTPPAALAKAGWYTYVEVVPSDAVHVGLTTPCGAPAETFRVQADPKLTTTVSAQRVTVGSPLTDRIHVAGLAGASVTIEASLYGPFPSQDKITCAGTAVWTGTVAATTDGDYETGAFTPSQAGYYTYRERIAAGELVREVETACADAAETSLVVARPLVTTKVNDQQAEVGESVTDELTVSGLGTLPATAHVELWGPFATTAAIRCTGTPFQVQTVQISGDGTYTTPPVQLTAAGYYTYRASILAGPLNDSFKATCGEARETVLVVKPPPPPTTTSALPPRAPSKIFRPTALGLTTVVSREVVRPGSMLFDRIKIRGVRGPVVVELFGPFATRAAIRCTGHPVWTRRIMVHRDGVVLSPRVRVPRAGLYGFRERVLGPGGRARLVSACAIQVETAVAAPLIVTGRGDKPRYVPARGVGALTPRRVRLRSLGIDAPVAPVGIDVIGGVLGVPLRISHTGWWRDGSRPTDASGVVLIAGHLDSAVAGRGAFFRLGRARVGDRIALDTLAGGTPEYRVVSVERYSKYALPTTVWSRKGRPRLVLVTCGGTFDRASGHYPDNVVVTAVPL